MKGDCFERSWDLAVFAMFAAAVIPRARLLPRMLGCSSIVSKPLLGVFFLEGFRASFAFFNR